MDRTDTGVAIEKLTCGENHLKLDTEVFNYAGIRVNY